MTYPYNRLLQEGQITYRYDDNGNLTEKQGPEEDVLYSYNAENRLTRVETTKYGVTIAVDYEYDVDGNRVKKVIDDNVEIRYLVDTNRDYAQVVEERDGEGNLLVRYVYGHDLISQSRDGATHYYHYDGLGSTRALSSSAGIVTDEYCYDAFGNLLDKTGNTSNEYLYTGEFFDSHLEFYYLRARYMNPQVGRFVTMDSFAGIIRDPYSLHKYLYAHANPVNNIDPSGYSTQKEAAKAGIIGILSTIQVTTMIRAIQILHIIAAAEAAPVIVVDPLKILATYLILWGLSELTDDVNNTEDEEDDDDDDNGRIPLYRAVGPEEAELIRETGKFWPSPGGLTGKYFSRTEKGARQYAMMAENAFGDPSYTLFETTFPKNHITPDMLVGVDMGVPTLVIPNDKLHLLSKPIDRGKANIGK